MSIKIEFPANVEKFNTSTITSENVSTTNAIVTGSFTLDGYVINPSSATNGQILQYNGSAFIATTKSSFIGEAITSGTSKSVLYVDSSGNLAQDNSHFAWDTATHYLGLGINSPGYKLHVVGDGYITSRVIVNSSSAAVSPAGSGSIRYNTSTNHLEFSENGGSYTAFGSGSGASIGSSVTGGTAKSVLFVDGSGNLAQDNSFFAWDVSNHYLGLGIGSPLYTLDVHNTSDVSAFHLRTGASSDDGFYINSGASGGATISVGAKNTGGGVWQARSATAGLIDIQSYGFGYYFNTGLSIGGNFTPSRKLLIDTSGNILMGDSSASTGKLQIETQDSNHGQIQIANTSSNAEASLCFISGATAIGTSPTSTNGTDHVWGVGLGVWGIGGSKFGFSNDAAAGSFATLDGVNYRLGVGKGNTSPATVLDVGDPSATTNSVAFRAGSTSSVSSSSTGRIRYNESTQHFEISENSGAYTQMASGGGGGMSIGGAVTSGTAGSILYVDSGPVLAQDNSNFFWDATNKRLGIGTSSPSAKLHIIDSSTLGQIYLRSNNASGVAQIELYNNSGTFKAAVGASNTGGDTYFYTGASTDFSIQTNNGAQKHIFKSGGTVGLGSATPNASNRLEVSGAMTVGTYTNTVAPTNGLIVSGSVGVGTTAFTNSAINLEVRNANANGVGGQIALRNTNSGGQSELDVYDSSANFRMSVGFDNNSIGSGPNTFVYTGASTNFRVYVNNAATTHIFTSGGGLGLNTTVVNASNRLEVNGAAVIGSSYSNTAAPSNGLIVQGVVGIGTSSPGSTFALFVVGTSSTDGVATYKNTSTSGYSNIRYEKSDGTFQGSMGFANASAGVTHIQSKMHLYSGGPNYVFANSTAIELEVGCTNTQAFIEWNSGGSAAVSASSRGRIRYNSSGQLFQVSHNAGSYLDNIAGNLTSGRVPYASAAGTLADTANLQWNIASGYLSSKTSAADLAPMYLYTGATNTYSCYGFHDSSDVFKGYVGYGNSAVAVTHLRSVNMLYTNGPDWIIANGTSTFFTITGAKGNVTHAPQVSTSGTPIGWQYTGAAHTTLAASTESMDGYYKLDRTVQFSTGALTTQRAMYISAPTYAFSGSSTLTNAATLAIGNAPQAGTNATITNAYALWVQAGKTKFDGDVVAGTDIIIQAFLAAGVGSNLTSGATITPTNLIHHVTGTSTVSTITAPTNYTASGKGGVLYIIPDGAFAWDTGGNIAVSGTAVVNRMITFIYDNGTSKWYPSYV